MINAVEKLECAVCGEAHRLNQCNLVELNCKICDNVPPPKARLTLPDEFRIERMADDTYSVAANVPIRKGTVLGPLDAQKFLTLDPSITFPLKIFLNNEADFSEYYLDTINECTSNWLIFITEAQAADELNVMCYQELSFIYYITVRDIQPNEFLKVWYAPHYAKKMKKPVLLPRNGQEDLEEEYNPRPDVTQLVKQQQKIMIRETWTCKFCGKLETNVTLFARHILEHYKQQSSCQVTCQFCSKHFFISNIKKHIKVMHNEEFLKMMKERNSGRDQISLNDSGSIDLLFGGPLLNNLDTDSTFLYPNMESRLVGQENTSLDLNVDDLIMGSIKDMDQFNFEIDESQEQYICDICLKQFTKLRYLILHLEHHTGNLLCKKCLRVFSRKTILENHVCRSINPQYDCPICDKRFFAKNYLQRHVNHVHAKKHVCLLCDKAYPTQGVLQEHICTAVSPESRRKFECDFCNKVFDHKAYLKKHVKLHESKKEPKKRTVRQFFCDRCGAVISHPRKWLAHTKNHKRVRCKSCKEECTPQESLTKVSGATTKSSPLGNSKNTKEKCIHCRICNESFRWKTNLLRHHKECHTYKCKKCKDVFETQANFDGHKCEHVCEFCDAVFMVKQSLNKHRVQQHSKTKTEQVQLKTSRLDVETPNETVTLAPIADSDNLDAMVINLENILQDFKANMANENVNSTTQILDFNDLEIQIPDCNVSQATSADQNLTGMTQDSLDNNSQYVVLDGQILYVMEK